MTKTQERLIQRAETALAKGRLQSGVRGDGPLVAALIALVKRLSEERDEYERRWLAS